MKRYQTLIFHSFCKSWQFPTFHWVRPHWVTLWETESGRCTCWKLKGSIIWQKWVIMISIDAAAKHCHFRICNICSVLSAGAVGRPWTGNNRTDSPSKCLYASLATRMFPFSWIKTALCCILTIALLLMIQNLHPLFIYWSSADPLPASWFYPFIHSDHIPLHFYNNHQCQLTINWLTMVTCHIVFPMALWIQHFQIFDSNALYAIQIFKSMLMVIHWNKNEIAHDFHK